MARQLNRKIAAIFGAAVLLAASHQTLATTLSASATIDWSNLTIEFLPNGLGYSRSDEYSNTQVNILPVPEYSDALDWTTPFSSAQSTSAVSASANVNADALSASTELQGDVGTLSSLLILDDGFGYSYNASARAARSAYLTITGGPGILVITVPVSGSASVTDLDSLLGLEVSARASANLEISVDGSAFQYDYASVSRSACPDFCASLATTYNDFLVGAVRVRDGDSVFFRADISARTNLFSESTPVPLPPALWLLGSAVGGLGLMRRRMA